jgi:nucleotide-binding universal stress UspA family protein
MTPKLILALIDGGPLSEATLGAGIAVAKQFNAHLDVLHVRADPATLVPIVGEGMSGAMVEQVMEAMTKAVEGRSEKARSAFDQAASKAGISMTWRQEMGPEPVVLAAAGRLADLTVIGRPDSNADGQLAASLDSALFDTGRPVLVAPPSAPATVGRRVALAWNGSAQSSRVISAALPYLEKAEVISVLTAPGVDKRAPGEALVAYLARHNLKAAVENVEPHGKSIGHALLEHAQKLGADLLVMGAYGHSRIREMILGGATRDVLAQTTLPVLMAH